MTIEEKAKAYDEALERARVWKDKSGMPKNKQGILDDIFPELEESEDERIRKWLIGYFHQYKEDGMEKYANGLKVESIIAWLEKQGEQKPIEWDADDDKFFFLKARLKDYEDCIIYDEELSEWQKNNVRETTKEFLEWLDSIKERIGG